MKQRVLSLAKAAVAAAMAVAVGAAANYAAAEPLDELTAGIAEITAELKNEKEGLAGLRKILAVAAELSDEEFAGVIRLLEKAGNETFPAEVTRRAGEMRTMLKAMTAAEVSDEEFVAGIATLGAIGRLPGAKAAAAALDKEYPLHEAALNGNDEVARLLVHPDNVDEKDGGGNTPFHYAARNGYQNVMVVLIDAGANINAENNAGRTPLWMAKVKNDSHLIYWLENLGAQ